MTKQNQLNSQLREAAFNGDLDGVRRAVEKEGVDIRANDDEALRWAAFSGHLDVVEYCVAQGSDIRASNDEALRWAAEGGHLDVVQYCREHSERIETLRQEKEALDKKSAQAAARRTKHNNLRGFLRR